MAEYRHGIYCSEIPTKVTPPILADVGMPVVIGTAPVHLARKPAKVNTPVLLFRYEEAVEQFGYSDDWEKYTLSEFFYSQFVLYKRAPIVAINVLDPQKHVQKSKTESITLVDGLGEFMTKGVIPSSIKITVEGTSYTIETDYLLNITNDETIKITGLNEELNSATITATFDTIDPELIDSAKDIIGGISNETGKRTGLELVEEIYPRFGKIPGTILAPKFSRESEVAAILNAKARKINGLFNAMALIDLDPSVSYSKIGEQKRKNNVTDLGQIACYPKLGLGSRVFNFSSQLAGLISKTDEVWGGVPYKSPSNERIECDSTVDDNGNPIILDLQQANYLNGQGIITANNFSGWRSWGNRTAAYPFNPDVKDNFISVRRMFDWVENTLTLTHWSKIDNPLNRVLIDSVIESANIWLNSLVSMGYLIGGKVSFRSEENSEIDLMDGRIRFHVSLTPPSPGREIDFIHEYDVGFMRNFIQQMATE